MISIKELAADCNTRELITFTVGSKEYGIDILNIQEIRGYDKFNPIVNTPEFISGAINMRGATVPLLDVRAKFNIGRETYNEPIVVIVLSVAKRLVGIVVDGVSDVIALAAEQIKPASKSGSAPHMNFIAGSGSVGERMIHVVDIEKLTKSDDMGLLELQAA